MRLSILLTPEEERLLTRLAIRERRGPKEQAAVLIAQSLSAIWQGEKQGRKDSAPIGPAMIVEGSLASEPIER